MVAEDDVPTLSVTINAPFVPIDADLAPRLRRDVRGVVQVPDGVRALGWMRGADGLPPAAPEQVPHPGQVAWWASLAAELEHDRWGTCWLTAGVFTQSAPWRGGGDRVVALEPDIAEVCGALGSWWFAQPRVTHALAWGGPTGPPSPRVPVHCRGAAVSIEDGQGMLLLVDDVDAAALARWLPPGG